MKNDLKKEKLALVTGGANRVGKEIALHLAKGGFDVAIHYFSSEEAAYQTKDEIESLGRKAFILRADLGNPVEIEKLFQQLAYQARSIDVLVNSAAVMPKSDLMKITWQEWDRIFNINLRAAWLMSSNSAGMMEDGGVIINISDAGADLHWTGYGAYGISKLALNEMTRLLAKQLAPAIRVCGIAPGLLLKPSDMPNEDWERLAARVPMKSAGDLSALLATIDLLIANDYITGEIITLNGGASLG